MHPGFDSVIIRGCRLTEPLLLDLSILVIKHMNEGCVVLYAMEPVHGSVYKATPLFFQFICFNNEC